MPEKGKISPRQAMCLVVSFLMGSAILIIPSSTAVPAMQDAWLSIAAATALGIAIIMLNICLAQRYPGKTFKQYSQVILGKTMGKAAGLLAIWFALHLGSLVVRDFGDFINITILPETPLVFINAIIVLLAALAVKQGLEVSARVNDVLFPFLIFFLLIINLLLVPYMHYKMMLPVLENGIRPVLAGTLIATGFPFAEIFIIVMLVPNILGAGAAKRSLLLGCLCGGALLVLVTANTLMILGPVKTAASWYPVLEAVRSINLFEIIQRIDAVVIINWIGFGFIKITLCYYVFLLGLAQWLALKDFRPLVLPGGVIMLALSIFVYDDFITAVTFASKIWPPYALSVAFIMPLILLFISGIRGHLQKGE